MRTCSHGKLAERSTVGHGSERQKRGRGGASLECGRYPFVADSSAGKSAVIEELRQAIEKADTVIIATDCDREGQAIGENISTRRRSRAPRPIRS